MSKDWVRCRSNMKGGTWRVSGRYIGTKSDIEGEMIAVERQQRLGLVLQTIQLTVLVPTAAGFKVFVFLNPALETTRAGQIQNNDQ